MFNVAEGFTAVCSWRLTTQERAMNTFCEHHQNSISLIESSAIPRVAAAPVRALQVDDCLMRLSLSGGRMRVSELKFLKEKNDSEITLSEIERIRLEYTEQGIYSLVWLAGYRKLISSLVIFDRSLRVRSENSVDLTGIGSKSTKRCLDRPDLVVAELEIVPA